MRQGGECEMRQSNINQQIAKEKRLAAIPYRMQSESVFEERGGGMGEDRMAWRRAGDRSRG